MKKTFWAGAVLAAALTAGLGGSASAMPLSNPVGIDENLVQIYGGCGPYRHRGPYGGCRAGGQAGGYGRGRACPPGFHLGPYGRRCWRN